MKRLMLVLAPALLAMGAAGALPTTRAPNNKAISDYYSKQAADAKQQLDWHESLYKTYEQNPRLSTLRMHCHRLIHIYKSQYKEDSVMADQYATMAKSAK